MGTCTCGVDILEDSSLPPPMPSRVHTLQSETIIIIVKNFQLLLIIKHLAVAVLNFGLQMQYCNPHVILSSCPVMPLQ